VRNDRSATSNMEPPQLEKSVENVTAAAVCFCQHASNLNWAMYPYKRHMAPKIRNLARFRAPMKPRVSRSDFSPDVYYWDTTSSFCTCVVNP
jgi:hypothetical protein